MTTKVLVVDDEETARDFCADARRALGFQTQTTASGHQALEMLESGQFDVVLADVRMPRISGLELLKIIREAYPDIHIVRSRFSTWNARDGPAGLLGT